MLCRCAYPAGAGNPGWPGQHPQWEIELHGCKTDPVELVLSENEEASWKEKEILKERRG